MRTPSAQNPRGFGDAPAAASPRAARPTVPSHDSALTAILLAPLEPGETAYAGFARKEAELRTALAKLTVLESRALHARLSNPKSGDELVAAFMRITADRRERLINFLADARRRAALGARR